VAVTAVVFMIQVLFAGERAGFSKAIEPFVLGPGSGLWTYITYQFLHGDIWHFAGNMLILFVFGPNVEDRFGRIGFLLFYLVGGIIAGVVHMLVDNTPVIGASGSIAAVTGAYLILFPKTRIKAILLFFVIMPLMIPAPWIIGFSIFKDIALRSMGSDSGVATAAHLGGYAFGIGLSFALLATGRLAREPYDLFTLIKQAKRRREYRELSSKHDFYEPKRRVEKKPPRRTIAEKIATPDDIERDDRRMRLRADVARAVGKGDADASERAFRALLDAHAQDSLPRAMQLSLGNLLFSSGRREPAAAAYDGFLRSNPDDPEAPRVRLMLALVCARDLNDPTRAKSLLAMSENRLRSEDERELWKSLKAELG
jgi:membrane associated rhomboid family serine protease